MYRKRPAQQVNCFIPGSLGDRVLEETDDPGTTILSRYTTVSPSYFGPLLHQWRPSGSLSRFPLYDGTGSARGLADAAGTVTDTYTLDAFGVKMASDSGSTPNPYHYDGAWGYITDPSGFQQLGYRSYWPELGRFIQQDPIGDGMNWYAYVGNNPIGWVDPTGLTAQSNYNFLMGWINGTLPHHINYGPGSLEVYEMQYSPGVNALRHQFYNGGGANITGGAYSTPQAAKDLIKYSRWTYTDAQVGGFANATVTNNGNGTVTFDIPNLAGRQSFFYHYLHVPNHPGPGPMHDVWQHFTWTERIDPSRLPPPNGPCEPSSGGGGGGGAQ